MRTLIISVDHPVAENKGSKIRTMHFARFFKGFGEVDLMCREDLADREGRPFFGREHWIRHAPEAGRSGYLKEVYDKLVHHKSWLLSHFTEPVIRNINEAITGGDYDAILCRYAVNAYPLFFLPDRLKKRVILDVDDLMSPGFYSATFGLCRGWRRIKSTIDLKVLLRFQERCLFEFGKLLVCSEADREAVAAKGRTDGVIVVPNAAPRVELPQTYRTDGFSRIDRLLFVGTLSYKPNEQGLIWFLDRIFPRLSEAFPRLRMVVVGRDPGEALRERCARLGKVELVVSPPDVAPWYERCGVVVVPLLVGGGTRIKILEAGLLKRPVISTPEGAYGLDVTDRRHLMQFRDAETFIEAYRELRDRESYGRLAASLHRHVISRFGEKAIFTRMEEILGEPAASRQPAGTIHAVPAAWEQGNP